MKGRVLIIGAGGVGTVVAQKVAMNRDIFTDITIASRTKSTIDALVAKIPGGKDFIKTAQVDADDVEQLCVLMQRVQPELVINVALPYQNKVSAHPRKGQCADLRTEQRSADRTTYRLQRYYHRSEWLSLICTNG